MDMKTIIRLINKTIFYVKPGKEMKEKQKMSTVICYLIIIALSAALLFIQSGCQHSPRTLSEGKREQLGETIGIVSAPTLPHAEVQKSMGKATGGSVGALTGFMAGGLEGAILSRNLGRCSGWVCGIQALVTLSLMASGAVIGGVIGGITGVEMGVSSEKTKEVQTLLNTTFSDLKIQETMKSHVFNTAQKETRYTIIPIEEQSSTTPGEEISYGFLASKGIDTVLEISVLKFGLELALGGEESHFFMTIGTRLIRVSNQEIIYSNAFRYRSKVRKNADWEANSGQAFIEELQQSYEKLAKEIIETLFLLYRIS